MFGLKWSARHSSALLAKHPPRESFWRRLSPPQLFVGSFLLLILLGTLGLKTLPGLYTGAPLSWLDALFTATSAVCVTGLIVVDTATYFTVWGQAFILLLIQLGGLGIITFTTVLIVALGRRLSLRQQALAASAVEAAPHVDYRQLARDVVRFTFLIEAAGALLLYLGFLPELGWRGAFWPAVFHAISAFCNAGFSTFSDSLVGFRTNPVVLVVVMVLIVVGGVGFLTLEELYLWRRSIREWRRFRLSLHSRLVLTTTALLLGVGWVFFVFFEWKATLAALPLPAKLLNGLFMSVTARTAGFNTIDYGAATEQTSFLTILLMFVGGSPGSTAGGIKTTTIALLVLLAISRLRGQEIPSCWSRSVPHEVVQRAVGLFVVAVAVLMLGSFVLTATEIEHGVTAPGGFLKYLFEAYSAFGTVGLSMGVTPSLSTAGRWIIILLMFIGRVGPLTFAAALTIRRHRTPQFRYAYEDVVVG
ncbi:TrkH family potassium uptake protein [Rhodothermus marinus]|uniref:TrkH family potassium uptake protein n=1 Tax=Rhodothermus marinus TaxID=29549 RepID=UPI000223D2F7|nr:TrkH family potassium uptake protein [Rhodothermus marinus]AEN72085.1 potassium uptake protein, TrkH family [Rhodothermus marinus SG0.5JP17-172]MBO2491123.1 potassium transporter TrkH [Rhodothermus marinus]BBM68295.1 potassium transporter TrkH [Rhodothermus marinus]BBM71268.1 potassium transporter TrkH [Rhodothermus marinus]